MAADSSAVLLMEMPTFDTPVVYGSATTAEGDDTDDAATSLADTTPLRASVLPPPASMLLRASGAFALGSAGRN